MEDRLTGPFVSNGTAFGVVLRPTRAFSREVLLVSDFLRNGMCRALRLVSVGGFRSLRVGASIGGPIVESYISETHDRFESWTLIVLSGKWLFPPTEDIATEAWTDSLLFGILGALSFGAGEFWLPDLSALGLGEALLACATEVG